MNLNNSSIHNESLGGKYTREAELRKSNFYASSFKQLNSMQTRQVGLIMGACVADAALRGLEELSEADIRQLIDRNDAYETSVLREVMKEKAAKAAAAAAISSSSPPSSSSAVGSENVADAAALPSYQSYDPVTRPNGFSLMDPCIFSGAAAAARRRRERKGRRLAENEGEAALPPSAAAPSASDHISPAFKAELLATREAHSYSYLFFKEYLRSVATHRHAVPLRQVEQQWGAVERLFPAEHSAWHGSAPHIVASLSAVPVNYPWAADDNLRAYSAPFAEFLAAKGLVAEGEGAEAGGAIPPAASSPLEGASVRSTEELLFDPYAVPQALSALSLPLRCMAHNPDPVRYNALQAMPFTADVFPRGHSGLVPGSTLIGAGSGAFGEGGWEKPTASSAGTAAAAAAASAPTLSAAVRHHQQLMRTAMHIVDKARTYTEGVLMCSRAATHGYPMAAAPCAPAGAVVRPLGAFALGPLGVIVGAALGAKFAVRSIPVEWLDATADHSVVGSHAIQMAEWSWNTPSRLRR